MTNIDTSGYEHIFLGNYGVRGKAVELDENGVVKTNPPIELLCKMTNFDMISIIGKVIFSKKWDHFPAKNLNIYNEIPVTVLEIWPVVNIKTNIYRVGDQTGYFLPNQLCSDNDAQPFTFHPIKLIDNGESAHFTWESLENGQEQES